MSAALRQFGQMSQVQRASPEQIVAGEVLQLTGMELEQKIREMMELNPTLELKETSRCPMCEAPSAKFPCEACGYSPAALEDLAFDGLDRQERFDKGEGGEYDAFEGVSARRSLKDALRTQWKSAADAEDFPIGAYMIECLDERGYLDESIFEIADRFLLSVPQAEAVLQQVQKLEPAGIAARDLRECLILQCYAWETPDADSKLAARILEDHWEDLAARRWVVIAGALEVELKAVEEAADWVRANLTPYPAEAYRDAWGHLTPRNAPKVTPDVVIRATPEGIRVEIVESRMEVSVDPYYTQVYEVTNRRSHRFPASYEPVRKSVHAARTLLYAISQRRRTLHQVMNAVAEEQGEFLLKGRAHLKPLLQKTIAKRLEIHESTVCRALANKFVQLPSGETVSTDVFFDSAAPVKEALRELIGRENPRSPLSDSRLTEMLSGVGYVVARRTVAKYREALQIPAVDRRRAASV